LQYIVTLAATLRCNGLQQLVLQPPPRALLSKAPFSPFVLEADFGTSFPYSVLAK
jgi:hypothetical protein